jgi:hypothetical protein
MPPKTLAIAMFLNLKLPRASEVLSGDQMLRGWISCEFQMIIIEVMFVVGGGALGHQIFKRR